MLNLSQLRFEVDSSELEKAVVVIQRVGKAVDDLNKGISDLPKEPPPILGGGSGGRKPPVHDLPPAIDKVTAAIDKANIALEFQTKGFSSGQSSQLAYLKQLGATDEQLKEFGNTLQYARALMGNQPFDKSLDALKALQNELKILKDVQQQYNHQFALSADQMKGLAMDKQRLIAQYKLEKITYQELVAETQKLQREYTATARSVNELKNAQSSADKAKRDTANANAYIAKEMERVTFATSAMNSELNRSTTNALLRFEKQLKLSGLSVDEQTAKLNAYKAALLQMDAASKKTNTDYVSRALGPQITDIFVGLSTGQSPLTVMLQQGGQLRDQFALAGIEADKMGQMMRNAAADMVVSVKAVALAFGQLIGGAFIDAGKGLVNYISEVSLFNKAITSMQERTAAAAATGNMWALSLQALGHILPNVLGVAIAGSVSALIAMAVAFYQVNKAQNEMSRNLVSFGASLGLTSQQAFDMAKNVSASGSSFSAILDVFSEIAKKGNIAQEAMQGITEAALKLESVGGNAATKTVELFSKLADEPVKALSEYAQATGLVTQAEILRIEALTKAGQEATATAEATRILEAAVKQEADLMYASLSPISRLWLDIKNGTKSAWAAVQEFSTANVILDTVVAVLQAIGVVAAGVWYTVEGLGYSLGALGAIAVAAMEDIKNLDTNFTALGRMKDSIRQSGQDLTASFDDTMSRILQTGKYEQSVLEARAQAAAKERQANSEAEQERLQHQAAMEPWLEYQQKHAKDMMTRQEFVNKALDDANKKLKEGTQLRQKDIDLITKMAGMEWDKSNKSKSSKEKTETYSVVADNTAAQLQKEYNAELSAAKTLSTDKLDILKAELSAKLISQSEYNSQAEALIAQSEQNQFNVISDYVRQINEAYDNMRKKKDEAFASLPEKDQQNEQNIQKYKADIENLTNAQQAFNMQVSSTVAKLDSDIFKRNTKNAIEHRGAIEALSKAYEDYLVAEGKVAEQRNKENVLREQLRWATPEQAAYIQAVAKETDRLTQAQQKLADAVRKANREFEEASKNGPNPAAQKLAYEKLLAAQSAYNKALAENSVKEQQAGIDAVINYQRDQLKEFSNGLSDAIVTAMFEGGKAGAGKFRDIVVAQLKKPVVMIVNAVVNLLLGSVMGSIGSAIFGSAVGGTGGNILGSIGSIGGILSIGRNIYSAITGGFSVLSGQVATWVQSGMNLISGTGGTIAQGPIQVGATASNLGTVAAYGAGITGGVMGGRLISGGYSAFGGSGNTAVNLGTLVGSWFGPVGALAGGLIGGTVNRLFGRKLKESGIEGEFGGETGFEGNRYEFYKGGWFRSDKTKRYPLEEETRKALADQYFVLHDGVKKMAEDLGLGTEALENFSYKFKLNLKGLSQEDAEKAIAKEFEKMTEAMAQQVIGTWENGVYVASEYARANETALDTLTRLSTSLSTVNAAFDMLGVTLLEGSLAGADAASALIDLFGGIANFNNAIGSYYSNFYSEQERVAKATETLTKEFEKQGLSLPKTREEYRKLVESQDLSTEEGRKMYKFLITLAPAFAEISDSAEKLAEDAARAAEDAAKALREKYEEALNSAYAALEKAVKAEQAILKERETAQTEVVKGLQSIFDILKKNVKDLYMQVDSTSKMLASQGRQVIDNALSTGVLPSADILSEAIGSVRSEIDNTAYATQFDADKARLQLAGDLKKLQDQAEVQLTNEELILKGIKDQIKQLDDLLVTMKAQVDAALGIETAVLSVVDAVKVIEGLIKPNNSSTGSSSTSGTAKAGVPVFGGGGGAGGASTLSNKYFQPHAYGTDIYYTGVTATQEQRLDNYYSGYHAFDGTGDADGLNRWITENKLTPEDLSGLSGLFESDWERWFDLYDLPQFAVGINRVPRDMLAMVHKDEAIIPAAYNPFNPEAIMPLTNVGGKSGFAAVGTADSSLVERVNNLEIVLQVIAVNTSKVARILDSAQGEDGRSIMTTST